MAYCTNCGNKLVKGAKYCQKCGRPVGQSKGYSGREQVFEGKVYKCPNCGEVLKSFVTNCPSCGMELRGVKATSSVREFALKLEAIESRRDYTKPKGFFAKLNENDEISSTDEQKISLIQNFSVPNTKEDMLEFMILATSNVNLKAYDTYDHSPTKSEIAINDAWIAKAKQVYNKAKRSFGNSEDLKQIQELYEECNIEIKKSKTNGIKKLAFLFLGTLLALVAMIVVVKICSPSSEAEEKRLNAIVNDVEVALEDQKYKYALRTADSIEYNGSDDERERWWNVKRESLIDEVVDEAAENGVKLKRPKEKDPDEESNENDGFEKGFNEGIEPGIKKAKKNISEFKKIMSENGD